MNVENLFSTIRRHEGCILHVYRCPAGKKTIGYGHNIEARPLTGYIDWHLVKHGEITDEMAEYLLDQDLAASIQDTKTAVSNFEVLSDNRQAVIVSMVFNMGLGAFRGFKRFIAAVDREDWREAAAEMLDSKWAKQVGRRAVELAAMMEQG